MAKFRLTNATASPLTRELAERFRTMPDSPTERPLDDHRLAFLTEKAAAGLLVSFHWATAALGTQTFRVNGQTSSAMLCSLDGPFPEGLFVHLDEYEVDDVEGLALLFRQFDTRQSSRTVQHVYIAYQGIVPALRAVAPATGKIGIEGIAWYLHMVEKVPVLKGDDVYSLVLDPRYQDFLVWLNTVLNIKTPELKEKAIVAAMYATLLCYGDEASGFWEDVARGGDEFESTHPTTLLDTWLLQAKKKELKKKPAPGELYQGCLYAWKAAHDHKAIRDIRLDTKKALHELLD